MFRQLSLLLGIITLSGVSADDWSGWRGPNADGRVNDGRNIPLDWSPSTAAWRAEIPGSGYSSPITNGQRIFLTTSGVSSTEGRSVVCVDLKSGDILWTTEVFRSPVEKMHRLNSPASSTAACDDQYVYVAFSENGYVGVAALNFDGKLIWKSRPGTFQSRHGFHSCPVVHKGRVLVSGQQDGDDAFVASLDCLTGAVLWKTQRPNHVRSFTAPFLIDVKGKTQVVVSGAGQTIAYDPETGVEIWSVDGPAQKTVSSMLTDGKRLFVPGGREDLLLAIDPTGSGNVTSTHIVWRAKKGIPYVPSPVLNDGKLHMVSDEGIYTCYDTKTGQLLKQARAAGRTSSSLIYVHDHILLTEDSGVTHVLSADGSGKEVHRNNIDATTYASLSAAEGALLIRTVDHLYCFRAER